MKITNEPPGTGKSAEDSMTGQAEAEFHGGPLDGRLQAVERDMHGNLPQRLPFAAYDHKADQHTQHQYRLRSDVGPLAAYDYDGEMPRAT